MIRAPPADRAHPDQPEARNGGNEMSDVRVFVGDYNDDPDWVHFDQRMPWADAHALMVEKYERWTKDDCSDCASYAASRIPALRALTPGTGWDDNIEGDDYMIVVD